MSGPSILEDVKKVVGVDRDYDVFDQDLILYINGAFATLHQLGVGPEDGFTVTTPADEWTSFVTDEPILNMVKPFVSFTVRLAFDPPTTSFAIDAIKKTIEEYVWRFSVMQSTTPKGKDSLHGQYEPAPDPEPIRDYVIEW